MSEAFYSSRRATGIVVSLERGAGDKVRIVFDDVERCMLVDATGWTVVSPYTWIEVDGSKLDPRTLSETELGRVNTNH